MPPQKITFWPQDELVNYANDLHFTLFAATLFTARCHSWTSHIIFQRFLHRVLVFHSVLAPFSFVFTACPLVRRSSAPSLQL